MWLLWSLLIILVAIATTCFLFFIRHFNHWMKNGVSYEHPLPFLGNFKEVVFLKKNIGFYLKDLYQKHKGELYRGIFAFDRPVLVLFDLELIKNVLAKDSLVFINHDSNVAHEKDLLLQKTLFMLNGRKWKRMRMNLAPCFTASKIKIMFNWLENTGCEITKILDQYAMKGDPVPINDVMFRYVSDAITSWALGIDRDSLELLGQDYQQNLKSVFQLSWPRRMGSILAFSSPELTNILRVRQMTPKLEDFMRDLILRTVKFREKYGTDRKDFIDSLMEIRKMCNHSADAQEFDLEGDDFVAQPLSAIIGGTLTSSSTMTLALYELALHPEIQSKLRTEILEVLEKYNEKITYDSIHEMKYLDMVVHETLRKYPVVPFLDRVPVTDYILPGSWKETDPVILRRGTRVFIPVLAIHHDEQYYPNPQKFDPERFTEENKQKRPNFTFLPFGEGPRICIGMRFGLIQIKTGLIHFLQKFEVEPCKETSIPLHFQRSLIFHPQGDVSLSIKRI